MTVSDKDMEDYARDCVRLAQLAHDPKVREQLMQMAREWMAAAMHEGKVENQTTSKWLISRPARARLGNRL